MTKPRTLDVGHLPDCDVSTSSPLWWGQLMMATIEASMFFMLIAMYFYLRLSVDIWPPPGTQLPHITLPSIGLVLLVLSTIGSYWAGDAATKNSRSGMLGGMILNVALGAAFLAVRFFEIQTLNFNWATDVHGSIFWSMLYLHTLDAVADLLYTVVLIVIVASGRYAEKQRLGVYVDSVVWYFIVAIWIPFYVVVYWGPHFVGAPR